MRILFFTKGDKSVGSSRQRVWLLAEKLKEAYGHDYEILHSIHYPFWDFSSRRFQIFDDIRRKLAAGSWELIFVHKSLFPWDVVVLILFAKWFGGKRLIYDLDDAERLHSPVKSWFFARMADHVFCGSHVILDWAQKINKNAILVPTVVDADLYAKHVVHHRVRERYTIGWVGAGMRHYKDGHFAIIKPALDRLAPAIKFRFVIIGAQNYELLKDYFKDASFETVFVDELDWADPEAVPRAVEEYQFDVGVMPQNNLPFNRAKCGFKIIEYMACGVLAVASPVGENNIVIQNGRNGYLAATTAEWREALYKLLMNTDLRKELGKQALATVKARYSYQSVLSIIGACFNKQLYGHLYRYTADGEGIFSAGKRLLPENLVNEARKARKWLPRPDLPQSGNYRFYLTSKGKEQYEKTLLNVHKKYLQNVKIRQVSIDVINAIGPVVYEDEWQVVVRKEKPQIIKDVGFDFGWDARDVWKLDAPVTQMDVEDLEWHFDVPFLWENGGYYNLKPQEVLDNPNEHKDEYERTMGADLSHPIDVMENKGRWTILDGLHRLMKAVMLGQKNVTVRIIPRSEIPKIKSYDS